jgi:uncharacterized protein
MQVNGRYFFAASPEQVWEAICDPATLKQCIPQCDHIERRSTTEWYGTAKVKIGPLGVPFEGLITLHDVIAPESYTLRIAAKSWVGTSHGQSQVTLMPEGAGTVLTYQAEANIGIKLLDKAMDRAEGLAHKLSDSFFGRLAEVIKARANLAT